MEMNDLLPIKDLLKQHDLWAKKSFGQHFLLDPQILDTIASYAGDLKGRHVIEIGPGPGGLTRALLARGAQLTAIEKDERFRPLLEPLVAEYPEQFSVVFGDATKVDVTKLITGGTRSESADEPALSARSAVSCESQQTFTEMNIKIVANLPYNVGTLLLTNWLTQLAESNGQAFERMTLMFQKEVAKRVVAEPNTKDYGRLSVISQFLCDVEWHQNLPAGAFVPPPRVASSVISLTPKTIQTNIHSLPPRGGGLGRGGSDYYPPPPSPLPRGEGGYIGASEVNFSTLEKLVATAFNQRRKMLRQALKPLGVNLEELFERSGIDGTKRAENLTVEEFCRLALAHQSLNKAG